MAGAVPFAVVLALAEPVVAKLPPLPVVNVKLLPGGVQAVLLEAPVVSAYP